MTRASDSHTYDWRSRNPGRALSNALRRFEERVLELMGEAGHTGTQRSHIHLTRHLDIEGTRITELARRAAMTNAAMTELIDLCSARGLVQRVADPADGRVRIVQFTPAGLAWLDAFGRAVADAEREMAAVIGPQVLAKLIPALARYGGDLQSAVPT